MTRAHLTETPPPLDVPLAQDHAWGGNYIALGGAVNGSQIFGDFPSSFVETSGEVITYQP